ncbi:hypothetical protein M433DRAFT_5085 [Acidomyces richmondensis BFW]|nr:MAG: hypothetical protein FE78DRAFT_150647 [Acidomyces sp. 'richmondensis']KYG44854.1 hypothetical protein M433DRAFT_5085 [Acidomyces richmondensis BFW]
MADDVPSSRKEKKALRDAERRRKGTKRNKPVETDAETEGLDQKDLVPIEAKKEEGNGVNASNPQKRKHSDIVSSELPANRQQNMPGDTSGDGTESAPKKRRKAEHFSAEDGADGDQSVRQRKDRFIVFVGNLPFSTTDASLAAHFKKLAPSSIRHRTDPKNNRSKGFAFLEFDDYDRMKTCLKVYHHTMFDPDEYTKENGEKPGETGKEGKKRKDGKGGRRINVELTVGGGGKKEARMERIKAKNERLEEQRKRRQEQERKEKARSERKGLSHKKLGPPPPKGDLNTAPPVENNTEGIHPSRLARMKT